MSDTGDNVKEIFEQMEGRFKPEAAAGVDCVIQYDLSGEGGATYHTVVKDGACQVSAGGHDSPSMTLVMEAADFVALTGGELDGMSAFMSGKLKVTGDMSLAMKMQTFFG